MARYALPKPPSCTGCPAAGVGRGYVPGCGSPRAVLSILGQGPGEVEAHMGLPFSGPSGHLLNNMLTQARIARSELWIDNVVRCWLPGNRAPTKAERDFCTRTLVYPALRSLPELRVVVTSGVPAAQHLLGSTYTERSMGTLNEWEIPSE